MDESSSSHWNLQIKAIKLKKHIESLINENESLILDLKQKESVCKEYKSVIASHTKSAEDLSSKHAKELVTLKKQIYEKEIQMQKLYLTNQEINIDLQAKNKIIDSLKAQILNKSNKLVTSIIKTTDDDKDYLFYEVVKRVTKVNDKLDTLLADQNRTLQKISSFEQMVFSTESEVHMSLKEVNDLVDRFRGDRLRISN